MKSFLRKFATSAVRNRTTPAASIPLEATSSYPVDSVRGVRSEEDVPPKPFSEIPGGKNPISTLAEFMKFQLQGRRHAYYEKKFEKYGKIYRETYGQFKVVNTIDARAIETMFRCEGKYPLRIPLESWQLYRDMNGWSRGVFTDDGPNWQRWRRILDQHLMKPRTVATYAPVMNEVSEEFVQRLIRIRNRNGRDLPIPDLTNELYHWSFESTCCALYEKRFGVLAEGHLDPDVEKFIKSLPKFFEGTERLFFVPYKWAQYLRPKYYKLFNEGFDDFFEVGKKFVDAKLQEIEERISRGEEVDGFLSSLLASRQMTMAEVYGNMVEVTGGAVDTTSTTILWAFYELSRHPDVQERLHDEVKTMIGEKAPTYETFQRMPFLRGVVKETLRLHPVGFFLSRYLQQDAVLCGYSVPKGTLVQVPVNVTGRDPETFESPNDFKPERWLRDEQTSKLNAFMSLPFGFGVRGCLGRRLAELEMYLLLKQVAQRFIIVPKTDKEVDTVTSFVMHPRDPIEIILKDRQ